MSAPYRVLVDHTAALLVLPSGRWVVRTGIECNAAISALYRDKGIDPGTRAEAIERIRDAYRRHLDLVADRLLATFAPADTEHV